MEAITEPDPEGTGLASRAAADPDVLDAFTGPERILGVLPFVADVSTTPRWHHLVFTLDKILAVPAFPDPAPGVSGLFQPRRTGVVALYPAVRDALVRVAIPEPLRPANVTAVLPYPVVRRARLSRGRDPRTLPELEIVAGRRTSWWFFRKDDGTPDLDKAGYARDLLLSLLPFPLELVGFSEASRPLEWRLRRSLGEPLSFVPPGKRAL